MNRYTVEEQANGMFLVIDNATGIRIMCDSLDSLMKLHTAMERAQRKQRRTKRNEAA